MFITIIRAICRLRRLNQPCHFRVRLQQSMITRLVQPRFLSTNSDGLPHGYIKHGTMRQPSHSDSGSLFAHFVSRLQQIRFLAQFPRRLNFYQSVEHDFSIDLVNLSDNLKKPRSTP